MNEISSDTVLGLDTEEDADLEEDVDSGDCCLYDASVAGFANDVVSSVMMAFAFGTMNDNADEAPAADVTIWCTISLLDLSSHPPTSTFTV